MEFLPNCKQLVVRYALKDKDSYLHSKSTSTM